MKSHRRPLQLDGRNLQFLYKKNNSNMWLVPDICNTLPTASYALWFGVRVEFLGSGIYVNGVWGL